MTVAGFSKLTWGQPSPWIFKVRAFMISICALRWVLEVELRRWSRLWSVRQTGLIYALSSVRMLKKAGEKCCKPIDLFTAGFPEAEHGIASGSRLMPDALNRMYCASVDSGRQNVPSWLRRPVKNHWDGWTQMASQCQRRRLRGTVSD